MSSELMPIGKLFNLEKGELQSTKCTAGEFNFITAAEGWKTHNEYDHECEALIIAVAASGSLGRTHYVDGKFITSDLCFILTPREPEKYPLNLAFYHFVFNSIRAVLVAATKSGTSKESISQTNLKKYELPYFDLKQQDLWIDKLKNTLVKKDMLGTELTHQQTLLRKLRQQILQEVIEGKLTQDWRVDNPDIEPASELLNRIQAEKQQLIKDKKIKKQKPLPEISEKEKPFELPDGWVWSRLENLGEIKGGGTPSKGNPEFWDGVIPWICPKDMKKKYLNKSIYQITEKAIGKSSAKLIAINSIMFVVRGMILSHTFPIAINTEITTINQDMKALTPHLSNMEEYLYIILRGSATDILKKIKTSTHGTCRLESDVYFNWVVALPSLPEQRAIVAKVEKLLTLCDQLESQITHNQNHAEQLMQAVLKEAFILDKNKEKEANVIPLKPTNVDFYKRMLLAAEITHQLYSEPTLGHLKLQKILYLCERTENMQLSTNFLQQAAGPYDPTMARSIDKQFKIKKWFEYQKNEYQKFKPLVNCGEHKNDFIKYFSNERAGIQSLIDLFRKAKSEQIEIVATLYACWENLLDKEEALSEAKLIEGFYNWSKEKEKFDKERLKKAIVWMTEQGIVPA